MRDAKVRYELAAPEPFITVITPEPPVDFRINSCSGKTGIFGRMNARQIPKHICHMRCVSLRSRAGSVPERWYEFITIARLHFGDWYRGQLREVMVKGCQVWKRPATRVLKESPEWWCSKTWRLAHSLAGVMSLLLCLSLQWPAVVSSEIFFNEGSASGVPPWPSKAEVGCCSAQENAGSLKDFLHRKMFWRWAYACLGGRKVINRWQTVSDIWHYLFFFRPVLSLYLTHTHTLLLL